VSDEWRAPETQLRLIEFRVANSIDRKDPWRMLVPLSSIACIEQHPTIDRGDEDVARLALVDGRVLWPTESYTALVERLRSGDDRLPDE
jgi:hypothetical protein